MFSFYYKVMKERYGDGIRLLYTDTDSVIIEIQTESLHEDMLKYLQHYDTSNFTPDHPLYTDKNKKVLGKFKDEITEVNLKGKGQIPYMDECSRSVEVFDVFVLLQGNEEEIWRWYSFAIY